MAEKLTCDKCGVEYTDEESLKIAKDNQASWKEDCEQDGVKARGLIGCPRIPCPGELILSDV